MRILEMAYRSQGEHGMSACLDGRLTNPEPVFERFERKRKPIESWVLDPAVSWLPSDEVGASRTVQPRLGWNATVC